MAGPLTTKERKRILFICTHNYARSQMAEGIAKALFGDRFDASSAGTRPTSVNPLAIRAMREIGIDISLHRAKRLKGLEGEEFDFVVTLCSDA